jgi:hypothetical protein
LQGLPDPADSIFWADELMGNGNGYVKTGRTMGGGKDGIGDLCRLQIYDYKLGPFKDWDTNVS